MPRQTTIRQPLFVIGPSIAYIPLTRRRFARVDAEDALRLAQWNWYAHRDGKRWYARRFAKSSAGLKMISMHRAVLGEIPEGYQVDHRYGFGLDNRKAALRLATGQQNSRNQRIRSDNKTGIPGVSKIGVANYRARITIASHNVNLGCFRTLTDARQARAAAEVKFFGAFRKEHGHTYSHSR